MFLRWRNRVSGYERDVSYDMQSLARGGEVGKSARLRGHSVSDLGKFCAGAVLWVWEGSGVEDEVLGYGAYIHSSSIHM